jgi:hypothetical protein
LRTPQLRSELTGVATQVASNYESLKNDSSLTAIKRAYKAAELSKIKIDITVSDSLYTAKVKKTLLKIDSINRIIDSEQSKMILQAAGQIDQINSLGIPIGYRKDLPPVSWFRPDSLKPKMASGYFLYHQQATLPNVLIYLAGIIITMFSLSVGAPFWFDLLVKFVNLRKAGIKPSTDKKN